MNLFVDELRALADNPVAWGAVPALALFATYSVIAWRKCPLLHRTAHISEAEAKAVLDRPQIAGPRFLILMVVGIAATVAGLSLIAEAIYPTLAFYLLLAGVFVLKTEPVRLQIREAEFRVVAARPHGKDAVGLALERLNENNTLLITLQVAILLGTTLFLLAF